MTHGAGRRRRNDANAARPDTRRRHLGATRPRCRRATLSARCGPPPGRRHDAPIAIASGQHGDVCRGLLRPDQAAPPTIVRMRCPDEPAATRVTRLDFIDLQAQVRLDAGRGRGSNGFTFT